MFSLCSRHAKATVADGKMVLSFPDAVTPTVNIIDLAAVESTTLKLETDKQGLHVIKRSSGSSNEVLAAYTSRDKALKALMAANDGAIKARGSRSVSTASGGTTIIQSSAGKGWKWFAIIIVVLFIYIFTNVGSFLEALVGIADGPLVSPPYGQTIPLTSAPATTGVPPVVAPETLGVPVDADAFLKNNRTSGF